MADIGRLAMKISAAACAIIIGASAFGLEHKQYQPDGSDKISGEPQSILAKLPADNGFAEALNGDENAEAEHEDLSGDEAKNDRDDDTESEASASPRLPEEQTSGSGGGNNWDGTSDSGGYADPTNSTGADTDLSSGNSSGGGNQLADDESSTDTPGDDPQDGAETDQVYFKTSIIDGETVENAQYAFTITHLKKELKLKRLDVSVNGSKVPYKGEVTLSAENGGRNKIRVAATYTDKDGKVYSGYREYTVYLKEAQSEPDPPQPTEPKLETSLYSHTQSDPQLNFTAYVSGEADNVKITVYHKNKKLKSADGQYSCTLDMGLNTIRISAKYEYDGEQKQEDLTFEIKLIVQTTPETAPYLAYQNVPENVRGTLYTLDLAPRDCDGNKLFYNNLFVRLNGAEIHYQWDGEYTSYLLNLVGGENTLDIRITDDQGRYADFSYVIQCTALQDGDLIGVATMQIDANVLGLGTIVSDMTVEIRQGESAAESIVNALDNYGFNVSSTGSFGEAFYIAGLHKAGMAAGAAIDPELKKRIDADPMIHYTSNSDPDGLSEKDYTTGSGWMITVNDHFTSYGTSDMHLKDGDKLRLRYTLAYGKDIGGYTEGDENYDICF